MWSAEGGAGACVPQRRGERVREGWRCMWVNEGVARVEQRKRKGGARGAGGGWEDVIHHTPATSISTIQTKHMQKNK